MTKISTARRRLENSALQELTGAEIRARDKLPYDEMEVPGALRKDVGGDEATQAGEDSLSIALSEKREKAVEELLGHPGWRQASPQTYRVDVKKKDANLVFNFYPLKSRMRMLSARETSEIIGQLKEEPCETGRKDQLLGEFNRPLFETVDAGKKVLVFIDEGNALKTVNLESLRLPTNMQEAQGPLERWKQIREEILTQLQ